MSGATLYERVTREAEVARRWWQLPPLTLLTLEDGRRCLVIYAGTPGGSTGPDVRDAVLRFLPLSDKSDKSDSIAPASTNCAGDIEFHLSSSDWFAHQHQNDPRYNSVILHVVFYLNSPIPTRRADGMAIPNCSLLDHCSLLSDTSLWPCQHRLLPPPMLINTLLYAGLLRLQEKSLHLSRELEEVASRRNTHFDAYDSCLLPALAEGLGYGRNRAFFRSIGMRLVDFPINIPDPLGKTFYPPSLDLRRLHFLLAIARRWQGTGLWNFLAPLLQVDCDSKSTLAELRSAFRPLSRARTDILLCNVILPFALAVAQREQNTRLANRARQLYIAFPGLSSNRVTRTMSRQLRLTEEPGQACLQQGLHYIYVSTCQTKRCQECLCGGQRL